MVPRLVPRGRDPADHGGIHGKHAVLPVPVDQVVAVQQISHVNVGGRVAPHVREELSPHGGGVAHNQAGILLRFSLLRNGMVRVSISKAGKNDYQDYAVFQINGETGAIESSQYFDFKDSTTTSSSTTTTSSTTGSTSTTSSTQQDVDVSGPTHTTGDASDVSNPTDVSNDASTPDPDVSGGQE